MAINKSFKFSSCESFESMRSAFAAETKVIEQTLAKHDTERKHLRKMETHLPNGDLMSSKCLKGNDSLNEMMPLNEMKTMQHFQYLPTAVFPLASIFAFIFEELSSICIHFVLELERPSESKRRKRRFSRIFPPERWKIDQCLATRWGKYLLSVFVARMMHKSTRRNICYFWLQSKASPIDSNDASHTAADRKKKRRKNIVQRERYCTATIYQWPWTRVVTVGVPSAVVTCANWRLGSRRLGPVNSKPKTTLAHDNSIRQNCKQRFGGFLNRDMLIHQRFNTYADTAVDVLTVALADNRFVFSQ